MNEVWALGARYCVRHDAHALIWLWGLCVALAATAVGVRRRWARFSLVVATLLAICTAAIGLAIYYGCYRYAPFSMGMSGPAISTSALSTFMCLGNDAFGTAIGWTIVVLSCLSSAGLVAVGRLRAGRAAVAISSYAGAGVMALVAVGAAFLVYFNFAWCFSRRLF